MLLLYSNVVEEFMLLKHLTDEMLINEAIVIAKNEREMTLQMLHHLKEIEQRKLYSDLKCTSLFDFCVRILKYSESSAYRRIQASKLVTNIPEVGDKIVDGSLSITNIALVNQYFKENKIVDTAEKKKILGEVENLTKSSCIKKLFELSGNEAHESDSSERVSHDKTKVSMILSNETLLELQKLKELLGEELSYDALMKLMVQTTIEKVEKQKFKVQKTQSRLSPVKTVRTVSNEVKREVYLRDKKCTICGSRKHLNYDHRVPWALGGGSSSDNIRLLCSNCNQRARIRAKLNFKSQSLEQTFYSPDYFRNK